MGHDFRAENLRAAAEAVKRQPGLEAIYYLNEMIPGWWQAQIDHAEQQAARAALAPLRECGVTADDVSDIAAFLLLHHPRMGSHVRLRTLAAALRKALEP
jgi:hypothetical protein